MKDAVNRRIAQARQRVEEWEADEVDPEEMRDWPILDVREDHEYAQGHLPGAVNIPRSRLEMALPQHPLFQECPDKVLVYCGTGMRSLLAADTLRELGVPRCVSLKGGIEAWRKAGKPVSDA